jgi:hypothetical protein
MLGAVMLVVGAVAVWLAADQLVLWWRERRDGGPSSWRRGGARFHSTGFEDTVPPHEAMDRRAQLGGRRP